MADDRELLRAWAAGDEIAGRDLFRRYYPIVARFFTNKVAADAPELVQETFLRCVESHTRFEERSSFRAFLLGIARNVFFKFLQSRYRDGIDYGVTSLRDFAASPTTEYARREQERMLLIALQRVPIEQQILLELYFWEDMRGRELAALYEVPEGTIRSRLATARAQLCAEIDGLRSGPDGTAYAGLEEWAAGVREQLDDATANASRR